MKKTLVLTLSAILLLSCCVPGMAAEATESTSPQYIEILDCEAVAGFVSEAEISVDTEDFTQGAASLSFTTDIAKEADATVSIEATFAPIDISYATLLEFDFYISDPALLRSTYIMTVDLGSAGCSSDHLLDWPSTAFDSITEPGWYHMELPFDRAIGFGFNAVALNYFRLYFMHVNPETDLTDVVVKLDNVRVRIPTKTTVTMDRCDFIKEGDWKNWMNNPVARDPVNKTEGTASLNLGFTHTPQYGGWSMVCENRYAPINATGALYLEMDVYVSDIERMKHSQYGGGGINIEIASSGECDWNEYSWSLSSYVSENGWTHIRLPIAEASTAGADRGVPDMSAINYLRFHILGVREGPIEFRVDHVYFTVLQDAEELFYGATPIGKQDDSEQNPEGDPDEDPGQLPDLPVVTPPVTENPPADTDSTLRAEQTARRAKILLLLMIFAIIGIDVVVMAVRRRNEQAVPVEGELPPDTPQDEGDE